MIKPTWKTPMPRAKRSTLATFLAVSLDAVRRLQSTPCIGDKDGELFVPLPPFFVFHSFTGLCGLAPGKRILILRFPSDAISSLLQRLAFSVFYLRLLVHYAYCALARQHVPRFSRSLSKLWSAALSSFHSLVGKIVCLLSRVSRMFRLI